MKGRKGIVLVALLIVMLVSTGCYWRRPVGESEVGLLLKEGVKLTGVVGAGRHTNWGYQNDLKTVNVSALTTVWDDDELVTRDKQPIGFSVFIAFARKRDKESITAMWQDYNNEALSDEALTAMVMGKMPRVAKAITTKWSLDQMLGIDDMTAGEAVEAAVDTYGRQVVEAEMTALFEKELDEIHTRVLDVGINNIAPDPDYMAALKEKALQQILTEVAQEKKLQLEQQVLQEQAQTLVDLEIAERQRLVAEERAKVYETNPGWLRLQIWEAAKEVFGGDNVWFIDPNADITLLFSGENVVPVEASP